MKLYNDTYSRYTYEEKQTTEFKFSEKVVVKLTSDLEETFSAASIAIFYRSLLAVNLFGKNIYSTETVYENRTKKCHKQLNIRK